MDIAAISTVMSMNSLHQNVGLAVAKMAMNNSESNSASMVKMLNESTVNMEKIAQPHLGNSINVRA